MARCLYAYRHPSSTSTASEPPPPSATPKGQGCGFTKEILLSYQHKHLGNELLKLNIWVKRSAWIRSPDPRWHKHFCGGQDLCSTKSLWTCSTGLGTRGQAPGHPLLLCHCPLARKLISLKAEDAGVEAACRAAESVHSHLSPRPTHTGHPTANLRPTAARGWKKQMKAEVTGTLVKGSPILAPRLAACAP